jgi:uncharacterized repeat protein (TIGR03803 family)
MLATWVSQAQTYSVVYNFGANASDGFFPNGDLIQDSAGNFYGTTSAGGTSQAGTIFEVDPSGNETVLYSFTGGTDGASPMAGLFRDPEGNLYGTAFGGGDATCKCGTMFQFSPTNGLTILHTFKGGSDGSAPASRLISVNGTLYGVTGGGGKPKNGTIYKITKSGEETVLHQFSFNPGGAFPQSVVRDAAGNLYGNTQIGSVGTGGLIGEGGIFKYDTSGKFSVLYSFQGGTDGIEPSGHLIIDTNGTIHGVTEYGGSKHCSLFSPFGCGVVFQLNGSGEKVLHIFNQDKNGFLPVGGLLDLGGVLYGTTQYGGNMADCQISGSINSGCGVIFQIGKTGNFSVAHAFINSDGATPRGNMTLGADGSIYGTTLNGGSHLCADGQSCGVIFKLTP